MHSPRIHIPAFRAGLPLFVLLLLALLSAPRGNASEPPSAASSPTRDELASRPCGSEVALAASAQSLDASGYCSGAPRGCGTPSITSYQEARSTIEWAVSGPRVASERSSRRCTDVDTFPSEAFFSSASFTGDGSELVLTDATTRTALLYDAQGRFQGRVADVAAGGGPQGGLLPPPRISGPIYAEAMRGTRYTADDRLLGLLGQPTILDSVRWGDKKARVTLRRPVPLRDGSLLACADIEVESHWQSAVVLFDPATASLKAIQSAPFDLPQWSYCQLALPLMTAIGGQPYMLDWWGGRGVVKIDPETGHLNPLKGFPERLRRMPELPFIQSSLDYLRAYKIVEDSTMVVELFSWEDSLFVLDKEVASGTVSWRLLELDPESGEVVDRWSIPSRAAHLTLVPGKDNWAIIEAGSVDHYLRQPISRIMVVDSSVLHRSLHHSGGFGRSRSPCAESVLEPSGLLGRDLRQVWRQGDPVLPQEGDQLHLGLEGPVAGAPEKVRVALPLAG